MSWAPLASDVPLDNAAQPAPDTATAPPAPSPVSDSQPAPQSLPAAPTGFTALPADAKLDGAQDAPPAAGLTPDEQQAVLDYLPKAKDAADLEQFAHDLTNGRASIGNAADVIAKRDQGHKQFSFENHIAPQINLPKDWRDKIGDAMIAGLSAQFPGLATFLQQARENGSGKAFTEHAANALVADYGPEVGGFLKTVADGGDLGTNIAHQRAMLTGDSDEHPVASVGGELTGAALAAPIGGEAVDAAGLSDIPGVAKAATGAAAYGSGAAGPGHRVAGAVEGAALGGATDVAAPYVIKAIPAAGRALANAAASSSSATPEAIAAAQAAKDLGVSLPKYALSDTARAKAGAIEAKPFGFPIRQAANEMMDTSRAARDTIASTVGTASDTSDAMGAQAQAAAAAASTANRGRIGTIYDAAKNAAGNIPVPATETKAALQGIIDEQGQALGGTRAGTVIKSILDDLNSKGGVVTIDGARLTRSELRSRLTNEAGATPSNADRLTNQVMAALGQDMNNGLTAAGREDAIPLYQQADRLWAQQLTNEDDVLKPYLGQNYDAWGSEVAKRINEDVRANGPRLAQFLSSMPEDAANDVRATLLSRLGRSTDANQNASQDAFSLSKFLTDYSKINGARKIIFSPETNAALDKLATIAEQAKASEKFVNRSNSGRVVASALMSGPADAGVLGAFASGEPKMAVLGILGSGLMAARQYGAAKLLANPDFAARIAKTPVSLAGAKAFWNRPWVNELRLQNPAIAGEIQLFQNAVNDNFKRFAVSANSNADEKPKNK